MAEHIIGKADLQEGEMKRIELEGKPIVLAKVQGQYYAFGGKCTHYGAPLNEGVLKGYTVICPWHHACFDIRDGERREPPAYNDLPHYPIEVKNGEIIVTFPHTNKTQPEGKATTSQTFVIIGGGAAGESAAEELRRQGFAGKIIVLSAVPDTPVDRPNLSKDYLDGHAKPEWMPLRGADWYAARDIDLRLNTRVSKIDADAHTVQIQGGETLKYDKLLLATGAEPRTLKNVAGNELKGIYTLRTLADADQIIQAAEKGKRAVVIGASFIGLEVAAALAKGRGVSVTVVAPEDVPFGRILGDEIGKVFHNEHASNGVTMRLSSEPTKFVGKDGHVAAVELKGGEFIEADFVVVGVGVIPATEFLGDSGLKLNEKDKSVLVDAHLQTSHPDIYAAGDIARWSEGSGSTRIEHWRVAQQQGIVAARNMLDTGESVAGHIPFFWTTQWDLTLNYVGHATEWDEIIYRGKPADKKFIAFYVKGGKLLAGVTCGHDQDSDAIELILRDGLPVSIEQMRDAKFDLVAYARAGTAQTA